MWLETKTKGTRTSDYLGHFGGSMSELWETAARNKCLMISCILTGCTKKYRKLSPNGSQHHPKILPTNSLNNTQSKRVRLTWVPKARFSTMQDPQIATWKPKFHQASPMSENDYSLTLWHPETSQRRLQTYIKINNLLPVGT